MYHLCKPVDDDEDRTVACILASMSRYREQLQVFILFPGNEFLSFLGSQLRYDDFRNVGQAMELHNSLNILPDPGLGRLLPERISGIE